MTPKPPSDHTQPNPRLTQRLPKRKTQSKAITRREWLFLLGTGTAAIGMATCGTLAGGIAYLQRGMLAPLATPQPTITPTLVPLPAMVSREQWGALPPDHSARNENGFYHPIINPEGWRVYDVPLPGAYQTVVVHHTAFYVDTDTRTVQAVQELHREDRAWADVAYHFFVGRQGLIYEGRAENVRGTHVGGYNTGSIGICLLGNFMEMQPTPAQLSAAQDLIQILGKRLACTHLAVHRHFNARTLCPGDAIMPHVEGWARAANLQLGIGGYIPPTEQRQTGATYPCACGCDTTI